MLRQENSSVLISGLCRHLVCGSFNFSCTSSSLPCSVLPLHTSSCAHQETYSRTEPQIHTGLLSTCVTTDTTMSARCAGGWENKSCSKLHVNRFQNSRHSSVSEFETKSEGAWRAKWAQGNPWNTKQLWKNLIEGGSCTGFMNREQFEARQFSSTAFNVASSNSISCSEMAARTRRRTCHAQGMVQKGGWDGWAALPVLSLPRTSSEGCLRTYIPPAEG